MNSPGSFAQLAAGFREGRDFEVVVQRRCSDTLVAAIHGGRIEPGTGEVAARVAGDRHSLYLFQGIRPAANAALHLTSTRFDEPRALDLARAAAMVLSIHGCRGNSEFVVVGGGAEAERRRLTAALAAGGFLPPSEAKGRMRGRHPGNICNRGIRKRGVQVEISAGLRRRLMAVAHPLPQEPGTVFDRFCDLLRKAIA